MNTETQGIERKGAKKQSAGGGWRFGWNADGEAQRKVVRIFHH